jgi:hypothetical protein
MQRTDLTNLVESYLDVKDKNYVTELFLEGKTEEEIIHTLIEAGMWDRVKSKWGAYNPFDSQNRENISKSIKGSAARLGKKGLEKLGDLTNTDVSKDQLYQKMHDVSEKGYGAESAMRGKKLSALVSSHKDDFYKVISTAINSSKSSLDSLNQIVDKVMQDYSKIGGLTNTAKLSQELKDTVSKLYWRLAGLHDADYSTNAIIEKILKFINQQKSHSEKGQGLRKADKLNPAEFE